MPRCIFSHVANFFFFIRSPCSELNRNRIRQVEGLTFQGLSSLEVLKLQRNSISKLTDGAFWDLAKMKVLYVKRLNINLQTHFFIKLYVKHPEQNLISQTSHLIYRGWLQHIKLEASTI